MSCLIQHRADPRSAKVRPGRGAARFKELVCRGTRWALVFEQKRSALAHALRAPRLAALPAASSSGSST